MLILPILCIRINRDYVCFQSNKLSNSYVNSETHTRSASSGETTRRNFFVNQNLPENAFVLFFCNRFLNACEIQLFENFKCFSANNMTDHYCRKVSCFSVKCTENVPIN